MTAYAFLPTHLARDASATATVFRVLIELQRMGAGDGWSQPTSARILAGHLQASDETVRRALAWLVKRQYIQRQYQGRPGGGRLARYRATLPGVGRPQ